MTDQAPSGPVTASAAQPPPLVVAYVHCYRAPDYPRSQSLLRALQGAPQIKLLLACNRSRGIWRYAQTLNALWKLRKAGRPDVYVLGFRGHEIFWPVYWLAAGKPVVFDALMSPAMALQEEAKLGFFGRLLAPIAHALERHMLHKAALVLTDTRQHVAMYQASFGVDAKRLLDIPVGAVEWGGIPKPPTTRENRHTRLFTVLFFGSMLPLHGIDTVVAAAGSLRDLPIQFDFVGGSARQGNHLHAMCNQHRVTHYTHRHWVPLPELIAHDIPGADLCLGGPFGGTPQARRVITGKTSQCLASGKVTVVGAIEGVEGFRDRYNCLLVPQADPAALAAAIRWAWQHRDALGGIGAQGRLLYDAHLSVKCIAQRLIPALLHCHRDHA